ncbi:TolB family protein [Bryobacter aggregatus]|uniref:TolB family protein n=1 Tax=Bryobacter aggregatus TaxID=360054 RepID=UPI0004E28857|nr:TolB family protein [Bryobacter aggregatus]
MRYLLLLFSSIAFAQQVGIFEAQSSVGTPARAGSARFDAGNYTVSGGGANMWANSDSFHFVWRKVSGDVSLTADIRFETKDGEAHKKGVLMLRQTLDADSAYADAALHADGLTSLQARAAKGERTHEIQANVTRASRLKVEKRGNYVSMWVDGARAGGAFKVALDGSFYVGLGVCAHNDQNLETAVFSNVVLEAPQKLISTLETITVSSTDRRVVQVFEGRVEAPNWTPDGKNLLYNGEGRLHKIAVTGGPSALIDTGIATRLNNDHGISPDGKWLAISDNSQDTKRSQIYIVPFGGGAARRVIKLAPSYWHGWSPDGKTLAYCAERNGNFDIYTIPVEGGEETRLTTTEGLDDGPDYSPDGQWIYFNSIRTGLMQVWKMKADGSGQTQVTADQRNNWFPHISPDGKQMVYISFEKDVVGHPQNQEVILQLMNLQDGSIKTLARLFGGQGTINVPSWSPDSKRLAFVSYQLVP